MSQLLFTNVAIARFLSMKLIIIFGPQAVGKMTVGQELEKITDLRLFHNHMTIELVVKFFDYSTDVAKRLVALFREEMFKAVAESDLEGMIFTYVWGFDLESEWAYIDKVCEIFESRGGEVCFVELEANIEERLKRNTHPNRLEHKASKRDTEASKKRLLDAYETYRVNSHPGEITREAYLRIDNTDVPAQEVARRIKERFLL